jgi:putative endopeptidase
LAKLYRKAHMNRTALLIFVSAFALSACNRAENPAEQQEKAQGTALGIVPASMDRGVRPGDDFFAFTNGAWVKNTPIPEDRSGIGAFYIADQERERQTRELLDSILKSNPAKGTNEARIANYYNAYLNTDAIDRAGMAPAKADLEGIARIADKRALSAAIGGTLRADTDPLNATNFQRMFSAFSSPWGSARPAKPCPT